MESPGGKAWGQSKTGTGIETERFARVLSRLTGPKYWLMARSRSPPLNPSLEHFAFYLHRSCSRLFRFDEKRKFNIENLGLVTEPIVEIPSYIDETSKSFDYIRTYTSFLRATTFQYKPPFLFWALFVAASSSTSLFLLSSKLHISVVILFSICASHWWIALLIGIHQPSIVLAIDIRSVHSIRCYVCELPASSSVCINGVRLVRFALTMYYALPTCVRL